MTFASQSDIDHLSECGQRILEEAKALVRRWAVEPTDPQERVGWDMAVGRELMLAMFLAARGEDSVNRLRLVEGIAYAIGETQAQQTAEGSAAIDRVLWRGLEEGRRAAAALFGSRPAGHA